MNVAHRPPSVRHHRGLWPVVTASVYLVGTAAVAVAEYVSEMSKISRGTYTDTFSPFLLTQLLTLPMSAAHSAWHGYAAQFSAEAYRHAVRSAVAPTAVNAVANTAVIFGVSMIWTYVRRHAGHKDQRTTSNAFHH